MAGKTKDLITELQRMSGRFSKREETVATYILSNLDRVIHQNQLEIANGSNVSVATVNRFCQTLGFDGFKDFRIHLAMNVSVSRQYFDPAPTGSSQPDRLTQQVIGSMIEMLTMTQNMLDSSSLDAAIERLSNTNRMVFFGVGGSSAVVAREGANRFFRLGKSAEAHSDGYYQRMLASTLTSKDTIVAISQSGRAQELIESVQIGRQYGVKSISITRPNTPLANASDIRIALELPEDTDIFKPTASRIAFISVIDILATGVARNQPDQSRESLRRIRSSLTSLEEGHQPRPIGD